MLHEHACVLPGFGTFFRQVSCMNMHNSCYVHVTCMVACYMNMHSMCVLHAWYMPVACMVLCMLHACTLPGLTCMYQTVVRTNGSKYNNNARRTQSVNVQFTLLLGFSDLLVIPVYDGNKRKVSQWHTEKLYTPYY